MSNSSEWKEYTIEKHQPRSKARSLVLSTMLSAISNNRIDKIFKISKINYYFYLNIYICTEVRTYDVRPTVQ